MGEGVVLYHGEGLGGGGNLAGRTLSQERVRYVTVQVIVLADSGCRVYTW